MTAQKRQPPQFDPELESIARGFMLADKRGGKVLDRAGKLSVLQKILESFSTAYGRKTVLYAMESVGCGLSESGEVFISKEEFKKYLKEELDSIRRKELRKSFPPLTSTLSDAQIRASTVIEGIKQEPETWRQVIAEIARLTKSPKSDVVRILEDMLLGKSPRTTIEHRERKGLKQSPEKTLQEI